MITELTEAHIKMVVENFYQRVRQDNLLSPVFNDIARVDWDEHIPRLCQFWNSIMLKTSEYRGNALLKHIEISKLTELTPTHFERWLTLFKEETIRTLPPQAANIMVERATMIADVIQEKITRPFSTYSI